MRIDYRTEAGRELELDVQPWAVVVRHSRWYLLCHSLTSGATRAYRIDRVHRVSLLDVGAPATYIQDAPPPWIADGVTLSGALLMTVGLPIPLLLPEQALVLKLVSVP